MRRIVLYEKFERFWHWAQALIIITMMLTGFEIRGLLPHIFGFQRAVTVHNVLAVALVTLIVFAIFWHITTGEWRQYIPTRKFLGEMVDFYLTGIFKGAPHPVKKHRMAKLNPLQRLAYLGFKVMIIPVQVTTGALFYFYPNLQHAMGWSPSVPLGHRRGPCPRRLRPGGLPGWARLPDHHRTHSHDQHQGNDRGLGRP